MLYKKHIVLSSLFFLAATLCLLVAIFINNYTNPVLAAVSDSSESVTEDSRQEVRIVTVSYESEPLTVADPAEDSTENANSEVSTIDIAEEPSETVEPIETEYLVSTDTDVPTVPFYSQFTDITAPAWKKVGCGVASLAMLISYYGSSVSVDELLKDGIASGAYLDSAGWTYAGLINLSHEYGLGGEATLLEYMSIDDAFVKLQTVLQEGPVMASVHYTFEPTNPIPHLVIINGVSDGQVFYNDPAEVNGGNSLSIEKFKKGWKKRYIEIRPNS